MEGAVVRVGTAGWSIPTRWADLAPGGGSHLSRYSRVLSCAEINSSFYRSHRRQTYERWAASVGDDFRFAVKMPKLLSHVGRLVDVADVLAGFLSEVGGLGDRLGALLLQIPPSLAFDPGVAEEFFGMLRGRFAGPVAFEPRHPTWFEAEAAGLLARFQVARVAADPAPVPEAAAPGGWRGFTYYRWHGSPRMYFSDYGPEFLAARAEEVRQEPGEVWCVFDNTGAGAGWANAVAFASLLTRDETLNERQP